LSSQFEQDLNPSQACSNRWLDCPTNNRVAIATVRFRFGLFLNWFGSQEGQGIAYHLLAIALALIVVVKGAGALSVDRLVYEHISALEQSLAGKKTTAALGQ